MSYTVYIHTRKLIYTVLFTILLLTENISLCNVIYKIGSKAIANRVKPFLNAVISPTQTAFVPGRLITDNVLVAYKVNHFIHGHAQGKRAYMALKLDVSKAYDRIEWYFLEKVLLKLGFCASIVELI